MLIALALIVLYGIIGMIVSTLAFLFEAYKYDPGPTLRHSVKSIQMSGKRQWGLLKFALVAAVWPIDLILWLLVLPILVIGYVIITQALRLFDWLFAPVRNFVLDTPIPGKDKRKRKNIENDNQRSDLEAIEIVDDEMFVIDELPQEMHQRLSR